MFGALDACTQGTPVNTTSNILSLAFGAGSGGKPGGLAESVSSGVLKRLLAGPEREFLGKFKRE